MIGETEEEVKRGDEEEEEGGRATLRTSATTRLGERGGELGMEEVGEDVVGEVKRGEETEGGRATLRTSATTRLGERGGRIRSGKSRRGYSG